MGWKSTVDITREKAIELIMARIMFSSNRELSNALDALGYGDNTDLPYYGCNFWVGDGAENTENT